MKQREWIKGGGKCREKQQQQQLEQHLETWTHNLSARCLTHSLLFALQIRHVVERGENIIGCCYIYLFFSQDLIALNFIRFHPFFWSSYYPLSPSAFIKEILAFYFFVLSFISACSLFLSSSHTLCFNSDCLLSSLDSCFTILFCLCLSLSVSMADVEYLILLSWNFDDNCRLSLSL